MRIDTSLRKNPCKDTENKPKHHHEHLIIYLLLWIEVVFAHEQLGKDCTEMKKEVLFLSVKRNNILLKPLQMFLKMYH